MELALGNFLGNFDAAVRAWDAIAHFVGSAPLDLLQVNPNEISDPVADFQGWINHFIRSGQIWALLVGMVLGWFVRGILK